MFIVYHCLETDSRDFTAEFRTFAEAIAFAGELPRAHVWIITDGHNNVVATCKEKAA